MSLKTIKSRLLSNKKYKKEYDAKTESELAIRVGAKVQELRIFKGLTQQSLAKKTHTKQPNIARIEAGKSLPSLSTLHKIAVAMNTHVIEPNFEAIYLEEYDQINFLKARLNKMESIVHEILTQKKVSSESSTTVWKIGTEQTYLQAYSTK